MTDKLHRRKSEVEYADFECGCWTETQPNGLYSAHYCNQHGARVESFQLWDIPVINAECKVK